MFKIFKQHLIDIAKEHVVCSSDGLDLEEWCTQAFIKTYNELPRIIYYNNGIENETIDYENTFSTLAKSLIPFVDKSLNNVGIDCEKSLEKFCEVYPDSQIIRMYESKPIIYNDLFIVLPSYGAILFHQDNIIFELFKYFIPLEKIKEIANVYYVSKGTYGFETYPFKLDIKDIEGNYNDDLPLEKINNIIFEDGSGIILFNSIPGTGKSTLLRYLVNLHQEKRQFLYLDSSVFYSMTDSSFIQFLLKHKNAVIILEDCEQILKSREGTDQNSLISTILNISDGLLGDSLNLKFICTFNNDLTNIDKAIIRKGRLKLKYEFKPLCKEKVAKIFEKRGIDPNLAKDMTLAEVYNFEEDNGAKQERKKVGF